MGGRGSAGRWGGVAGRRGGGVGGGQCVGCWGGGHPVCGGGEGVTEGWRSPRGGGHRGVDVSKGRSPGVCGGGRSARGGRVEAAGREGHTLSHVGRRILRPAWPTVRCPHGPQSAALHTHSPLPLTSIIHSPLPLTSTVRCPCSCPSWSPGGILDDGERLHTVTDTGHRADSQVRR